VSHGNEVAEILSGMHVNALIIPHTVYARSCCFDADMGFV